MKSPMANHGYVSDPRDIDPLFGDLGRTVRDLPAIDLLASGVTAAHIAPLTESRTLIVAIPESTVEDFGKFILRRQQVRV